MKTIEVVAAIIIKNGRVLATERGYGEFKDFWEFPGGKIEKNETREEALVREISEELTLLINPKELFHTVQYDYPNFHLTMHCFICEIVSGEIKLLEHEDLRWLTKEELSSVKWLPADIEVAQKLQNFL